MSQKIGIIGGGMMGLTLAYRLSRQGYKVSIIETRDQMGGLSTWFDYGDFTWDKYYHVILRQDNELLALIEELSLKDQLCWETTLTGFLWKKQLFSMSNYWEFLRFPPLNIFEKIRLGCGILYSHYLQKPEKLDGLTAKEWLINIFGKGVFSAIWEPLLESKFGILKEKVPAFLLYSTINRYYGTRSKSDGKEWMGYLSGGGLKVLIDRMIEEIQNNGGTLNCNELATSIDHYNGNIIHVKTNRNKYQFDRLISTIPSVIFDRIHPSFREEKEKPNKPEFLGVIRLALILDKSLCPFYVTNLIDKNLPYTGIVELSKVVNTEEFGKKSLIMLPRYDVPSSPWFKMSDEEIKSRFLSSLKETWPSVEKHIVKSFVHRESIVQAVWIDGMPSTEPQVSKDGRIWSINAELAGCDNLNNNAIIRVANSSVASFLKRDSLL